MASITVTIYSVSPFYDTVGLYPLIYLHSEHHPRHLLYTDCPASFPPLLQQWAHTSSFTYSLSTNLVIYCTQTVQIQLLTCTVGSYPLILWQCGPIPPIYLHNEHHPRHLLYTDCPASFPPLLAQWAHTSSFMTQWAYTPSFTYK